MNTFFHYEKWNIFKKKRNVRCFLASLCRLLESAPYLFCFIKPACFAVFFLLFFLDVLNNLFRVCIYLRSWKRHTNHVAQCAYNCAAKSCFPSKATCLLQICVKFHRMYDKTKNLYFHYEEIIIQMLKITQR